MIVKSLASVAACVSGIAAGIIVMSISPLFKWRIPSFLTGFASKFILPLIQSTGPRSILRTLDTIPRTSTQPTPPAAPSPSEQDVSLLVSMGFDRDVVIRALQRSQNNVEWAAARLLHEMS